MPPVEGETRTLERTFTVDERDDRYESASDVVCENEDGEVVSTATVEGLVREDG